MWKIQNIVRGEDVDEVENWLELKTGAGCVSENEPQWDQARDGRIGTGSSKKENEQMRKAPTALRKELKRQIQNIVVGKKAEKENGRNKKQELEYGPEAVPKGLPK